MILKEIFYLHNKTNIRAIEDYEGVFFLRRKQTNRFSITGRVGQRVATNI